MGRSLFREVSAQFLAHNALYAATPSINEYQVRVFVRAFGERFFDEVGRAEWETFFGARRAAGIRGTTLNRNRQCALTLYRWAIERGVCASSPLADVRKFKERPRQGLALSLEEFAPLYLAADPDLKLYLLGLLWTGGRRTETMRVRRRDFDPVLRSITFTGEHSKNGKARTVPCPEPLYRAIVALPPGHPDDRIFRRRGKDVESMRTALWTACDKVGLPRIGWHVLRRTFASAIASANGCPLDVLQDLLGHASPVTTKRHYIVRGPTFLRMAESFLHPPKQLSKPEADS